MAHGMSQGGYRLNCKWVIGAMAVLALYLPVQLLTTRVLAAETTSRTQMVSVPQHKSRLVELPGRAAKVSVGNPEIADILILQATNLYILGKKLGTTNVIVWDSHNRLLSVLDVEITHDLNSLKAKLHQFLPDEEIAVHTSQNKLILSGQVSSAQRLATAMELARTFTGETRTGEEEQSDQEAQTDIINLMTVGGAQQVMLEVTVAEVQRSLIRRFNSAFHFMHNGSNWSYGGVSGGATFPDALFGSEELRVPIFGDTNGAVIGPMVDEFAPNPLSIADKGLFGSYMSGSTLFNVAFDIAKTNGVAKVLAEPTLTSLSGESADFLSGGEFPIPVPNEDGITIDYKEFGVGLKFVPTVLDTNRINLNLNVLVSEISNVSSVSVNPFSTNSTFFVPSLTKRSATTTVELGDGQTIGIAGLLSESLTDSVDKLPGLGDLPILGQLFRSQEFQKGETELVILVTPRLAKPVDRSKIRLPTDGFVEPSDLSYYLLGRMSRIGEPEATESATQTETQQSSVETTPGNTGEGIEGQFGHSL